MKINLTFVRIRVPVLRETTAWETIPFETPQTWTPFAPSNINTIPFEASIPFAIPTIAFGPSPPPVTTVAFDPLQRQSPRDPLLHSGSPASVDLEHPLADQERLEARFSRPSPPLSPMPPRSNQQSPASDLALRNSIHTPPNVFFPYDDPTLQGRAPHPPTSSAMSQHQQITPADWPNHLPHRVGTADYTETHRFPSTLQNHRHLPQYRTPPPYLMESNAALVGKMDRTLITSQNRAHSPAGYPSWNYSTMTGIPPPNYHAHALQQQQERQRRMYHQELMFHQQFAQQQQRHPLHHHQLPPHTAPPPHGLHSSSQNGLTYAQSLRRQQQQQLQLQQMEASEFMRRQQLQQYSHHPEAQFEVSRSFLPFLFPCAYVPAANDQRSTGKLSALASVAFSTTNNEHKGSSHGSRFAYPMIEG